MIYDLKTDNDLVLGFKIWLENPITGVREVMTSGSVSAFLSAIRETNATAADATLVVACAYMAAFQEWRARWNATLLTRALMLDVSKFPGGVAYAHCVVAGDINQHQELRILSAAPAVAT